MISFVFIIPPSLREKFEFNVSEMAYCNQNKISQSSQKYENK